MKMLGLDLSPAVVSKKLSWGWAGTQVLFIGVCGRNNPCFHSRFPTNNNFFLEIFVLKSSCCPFYSPPRLTPPSGTLPLGASSEPPSPQNVLATGLLTKTAKPGSPLNVVTRFGFLQCCCPCPCP